MRINILLIAGAAVLAFGAGAQAVSTIDGAMPAARDHTIQLAQSPVGPPDTGTPRTTEGAPGQKGTPNNPTAGQKKGGTTGQGVGGNVGGNAQQPGGTNNEQTGTQSHDAQKGGSGSHGAR